jgi:hypothetical protein
MAFVRPKFTKGEVNKAGDILKADRAVFGENGRFDVAVFKEREWADAVLTNWRGSHTYPINTFQATLRLKLRAIDPNAIVAQRLKRTPSIVLKLQRFDTMKLARMQDIGGLRAIVASMAKLRALAKAYEGARFTHERISFKDYVNNPKADGYRGLHLVYRYNNPNAPEYDGLSIELQFRTRLQHAWATAVETMGTFLGQALKSGQGEDTWREFFSLAGAALALMEHTEPVPGYEDMNLDILGRRLAAAERRLRVIEKLRGFAVATNEIHTTREGKGAYHLIVLDSRTKSVRITPFPMTRLEDATKAYSEIENRGHDGEPVEAVLVAAGPIENLRKAYPNYFLDTDAFIRQIERLISLGSLRRRIRVRRRRTTITHSA